MQEKNIEAFIIAWNESETIGLTIKHYQAFCSKVTLFDNFSTDNTKDIAKGLGCEVITFGREGELNDAEYLKVKNRCWKKSKADFVIVVDADEILEPPVFEDCTIYKTQGFNIYSHKMPKESYFEILTGVFDNNYSKSVIFSPKLEAIDYSYGAHTCNPKGDVRYSEETLTLFHYRCIGGPERLINRHKLYRERMGYLNKQLGLGSHYNYDDERRETEWIEYYEKSEIYSAVGF